TCDAYGCWQQTPTEAMCLVECQVNMYAGFWYNATYGTVVSMGIDTGYNTTLVFDSNGTSSLNSLGVNVAQTVYKVNPQGQAFVAQPGQVFTPAPNLDHPTGGQFSSLASRADGIFLMAPRNGTTAYYFPPNTTDPPIPVIYTNLPGNAVTFCSSTETCYGDIAFDGNGYLWVFAPDGHIFISTTSQTTALGGPLKYIGTIPVTDLNPGAAIAFDAKGNVYMGGNRAGAGGFLYKATMEDPLNGSIVLTDVPHIIDLATCVYPTNDISHLLA
ncbi:hypothetical protein BGW41_000606, partial [Actinomortierella wolfii]